MGWVGSVPWGEITSYALLVALAGWIATTVIKGLVNGAIVPRRSVDDAMQREEQWREVATTEQKINAEQSAQLERLIAAVEGSRRVVEALPKPKEVRDGPAGKGC